MKIIKRDGKIVDYDRNKIEVAIDKANGQVPEEERVSKTQVKNIINYIESLNKKRMLVEDIQDIIENANELEKRVEFKTLFDTSFSK